MRFVESVLPHIRLIGILLRRAYPLDPNKQGQRMKGKTALGVTVLTLALIAAGAAQAAAINVVAETTDLPEVKVEGKRLSQLRQDMVKAEDRFFAAFNELNQDDEFDIHCATQAPLGTHIQRRVCKVRFYEKAQEEEARAFLTGDVAPPAELVAVERSAEYRQKALAVINAHPELRRMIREREALEKKYDTTRKARFKGRWILFE